MNFEVRLGFFIINCGIILLILFFAISEILCFINFCTI